MSLIKRVLPILIFLLIVAVAWVGFSVYFQSVSLDIDPNATNYTKPINSSFDTETITGISQKTIDSFPVSPQEFLRLNNVD